MSAEQGKEKVAVVLAGHGVPAIDCPPALVGELMGLQWGAGGHSHGRQAPGSVNERIRSLEEKIRRWPRTAANDPYKAGIERLAEALRPLLPTDLLAIGYNEFCGPSVAEAIEQVIGRGATRVLVIPSMLTPGGVHSEQDIPRTIAQVRGTHPSVAIDYVWPFDLSQVAALLADHVSRTLGGGA